MCCDECADAADIDGVIPDCQTERGCLIPPLPPEAHRIIEIRDRLIRLQPLVDAGTICKLYDVDTDDLELLAEIEDIMRELNPEKTPEQ